jgi:uncharacterized protein (TIGR04255 family)
LNQFVYLGNLGKMVDKGEFCPEFDHPPVIETRIGVQFAPLIGLKSGHFGLFWEECLDLDGWRLLPDTPPSPKDVERFGSKQLRPPVDNEEEEFPPICMRVANEDNTRTVQFQANKLIYGWNREKGPRPSYSEVKVEFDALFGRLQGFAAKWALGKPEVNFWELTYVNKILPGNLWQTPSDWHRVLPGIFPPGGPSVDGHEWATFNGTWFFVIPPEIGRVRVRVQKALANQTGEIVLLLVIAARGETGPPGVADWSVGVELGHRSATRVFYDLASPEARKVWGLKP